MKIIKLSALMTFSCISIMANTEEQENLLEETLTLGRLFVSDSEAGSRLDLSPLETPATIDVIDGDAIRYRRDLSVLDAVTRSAGFVGAGNPGNGGTSLTARGFTGQDAVTKLYDGNHYFTLAGTTTFPFDTWAVERIEILKGPASVLYGQGGVAGAINVIPKSPTEEFELDLRLTAGENQERFYGASIAGTVVDSLTARADLSKRESDNWVENGESEAEMLALALQWEVTPDLILTLRHDAGDQSPMRYFGIPVVNGGFNEDWIKLNFNAGDSRINYDDEITRIITDWDISNNISVNAELFSLDTDRYWQTVETYAYDAENDLIERADPLIIRHQLEQAGLRASALIDSKIGDMGWKTSVGLEVTDVTMNYTSNFNPTHPDRIDWDGDTDTVDPNNFDAGLWSDLTDSLAALDQVSDVEQIALFAESQLKITDSFALVAGLRIDSIETEYERLSYTDFGELDTAVDNTLSQKIEPIMGRIGAVYDVNPDSAIYAQYSTGETHPNGGDVVRVRSNFRESNTVTVEQAEAGFKQSLFEGNLNWSIAFFNITKQDLLIDDPDSSDPTDPVSVPEQRSTGIEASMDYAFGERLTGYANTSIVNAERDTDTGSIDTPYVPELTFNAGLLYSPVEYIRLGADLRYADEQAHPSTPLPSYSIFDLALAFDPSENITLTVNAINITDELYAAADHWTGGQWSVGQPRTVSLTLDLDF